MTKLPYHKLINYIFSIATALLLISCGGGGGGGGVSTSSSYVTTEYNNQYGLGKIKASAAYDRGYNGDGTKVAVLDGGFDTSHTDLDANFITGYDTEDSNNTPNADTHTSAMGGHGTHVAGIIAAEKNDSGMHGVAYNASIIPVKVFKDDATGVSGINLGIDYATDNGAIALNNSWGTSGWTGAATCGGITCYGFIPGTSSSGFNSANERTEWDDVATENAVAIFAAGNNGNNSETGKITFYASRSTSASVVNTYTSQVVKDAGLISYVNRSTYEARFGLIDSDVSENWLNVVNVDSTNTISSTSNGCGDTKAYCIAAPGTEINSTVPTSIDSSGYAKYSGTSMAAPHVSAAVAILKEEYPNLTGAQIVDLLLSNATDLGASGTDEVYGVGLLNLEAATKPSGQMVLALSNNYNDLTKSSLNNSSLNFGGVFDASSIGSSNFIGVVDDYDRVYSLKLKDFAYQNSEKNTFNSFLETREKNISKTVMDKYNYVSAPSSFDNKIINYNSFMQQNGLNPYISLLTTNDNYLNFHNNLLKSNFIIPYSNTFNNSDFIITRNLNISKNTNLDLGILNEENKFLGSSGDGIFDTHSNTKTIFLDYENLTSFKNFDFLSDFTIGYTDIKFKNEDFIKDSDVYTSSYSFSIATQNDTNQSKTLIGFSQPLSVYDGSINYKTISGYSSEGDYVNREQEINLKNIKNKIFFKRYKFLSENSVINFGAETDINDYGFSTKYEIVF